MLRCGTQQMFTMMMFFSMPDIGSSWAGRTLDVLRALRSLSGHRRMTAQQRAPTSQHQARRFIVEMVRHFFTSKMVRPSVLFHVESSQA